MNKNYIILSLLGVIIFGSGFFIGTEYQKYVIAKTVGEALGSVAKAFDIPTSNTSAKSADPTPKPTYVDYKVGDEVELATLNFKVVGFEEKTELSKRYSDPTIAKDGTKFLVVEIDMKNTTNNAVNADVDDTFALYDNKGREYTPISAIGILDNYLDVRELAPSINESGFVLYELPEDSSNYSIQVGKAGTNETHRVILL